jgi:hypothetical protein
LFLSEPSTLENHARLHTKTEFITKLSVTASFLFRVALCSNGTYPSLAHASLGCVGSRAVPATATRLVQARSGSAMKGKISGLRFDRFGDFEGF